MSKAVRLGSVIRGGGAKSLRVERVRVAYSVPSPADIPSADMLSGDLGFRTFRRVLETLR